MELTILMPCLNEEKTVGACVTAAAAWLKEAGLQGEVLVADNGSMDGSTAVAREAGARVIPVAERGYGAALRAGIQEARGRYVILGDADGSYDFSRLDGFMAHLREGNAVVMGNRFRGGIAPGAMPPLHRYLGNPTLSRIGQCLFPSPCGDLQCGLRGIHRESVLGLGLECVGMEFCTEMIVKAIARGLKVCEIPTTLARDGRDRPSHLRSWPDGWRMLRLLVRYRFLGRI
jgi:glycosyltransferase involved in cell wall biosynthesis